MQGQAPGSLPTPAHAPTADAVVASLQHLGWIDITALTVLLVFFVLGLFKGIVWQVSRVVILAAAYTLSARLGQPLAELLLRWTHSGPNPPTEDQQQTAFYIGCVLLFVGVLVVLSLFALLLQKLINKAGLGFYDRLFGGVLGVGSGAIVVLFLLTAVYMFFPQSGVAAAATSSHSLELSRKAVDLMGPVVPDELRRVFPHEGAAAGAGAADPTGSNLPSLPVDASGQPRSGQPKSAQPPSALPKAGEAAPAKPGGERKGN